jgi:HSP20 family molecular chaperone IbpA
VAERENPGGGSGFEGLLRNIGDLLHQAANISSDMRRRDGQRPAVESRMSLRSLDGEDIGADFFGLRDLVASASAARQPEDGTPPPPDRREAAIDLIATPDIISAIVELPGAEAESLTVRVEHDMLTIAASGCGIEYSAEALLPAPVDDAARQLSFRNGVLELRWPRAKAPA